MVASVRSVVAHPLDLVESLQAERGAAQPGDIILAFQSADVGSVTNLNISGGGAWAQLAARQEFGWAGTRIRCKQIGSGEPTRYTVSQEDEDGAGTVIFLVLADADLDDIVITAASGTIAPTATPGNASGLEIRYSAGAPSNEPVTWGQLPGYSGLDLQVLGTEATAAIAVRPFLSSNPVGQRDMAPDPADFPAHAFTVLVSSSGSGGGPAPEPPTFPASTPGKGASRMRYTVHDFLTGGYRGDIYPFGVTLDRRIGEPGTWRGRLAIPNNREGGKINEIFPRDPAELRSGPGMLVVHTWRSGVLWGIHWLHTTETSQDNRGTVWMDVQGSTLDAYLAHVALETSGDLVFGSDQIANARSLILHQQANPSSSAGLGLMDGLSGVVRPLIATPGPGVTYGRILQDYARASDGFEQVINPRVVDGSIIRSWEWGAPKIINDVLHVFAQAANGGDVTSWRERRSILDGGTRWGAYGGTPEQEDATMAAAAVRAALVETAHVAEGWPIVDNRPVHPAGSTDQGTIDDYAVYMASRFPGAPPIFSCDVLIGPGSTLGPNSLGDSVRIILNNARYPIMSDGRASFNRSQRLIGWEFTPAERSQGGKDRVKLIAEGVTG